jgi:hypothetical protein
VSLILQKRAMTDFIYDSVMNLHTRLDTLISGMQNFEKNEDSIVIT